MKTNFDCEILGFGHVVCEEFGDVKLRNIIEEEKLQQSLSCFTLFIECRGQMGGVRDMKVAMPAHNWIIMTDCLWFSSVLSSN